MTETQDTAGQQVEIIEPDKMTLLKRAAEIDRKHRRVEKTAQNAVTRWIALGHELVAAKKQVREELGRGKWLVWRAENTEVSERTAQMAVDFAKHETQLNEWLREENRNVADLSIRDASQIIRLAKKASDQDGGDADPDDKQFEVLREAYEDANLEVRERFHHHLEKFYGLEVRLVETPQQEQPDDGAVTAAVKTSDAEPHAAEAGS